MDRVVTEGKELSQGTGSGTGERELVTLTPGWTMDQSNVDRLLLDLADSVNRLTAQHRRLLGCLQCLRTPAASPSRPMLILKRDYDYFADLDARLARLGKP